MSSKQFRKLSAWAGILAPIIFVGVFLLEGTLRNGYDPISMYISELSLGDRGWIQIANFMLLGFLLFLFALGLSKEFQTGKASRWGIIAFYVISGLVFILGPFIMDPAGTPVDQMSVPGLIHELSGGILFLLMPIIIFIFLRRFISDEKWGSLRWWTLILGVVEALGVFVFIYAYKIPAGQSTLGQFLGLFQRIAVIPFMVWVSIFGIKLLRNQTNASFKGASN